MENPLETTAILFVIVALGLGALLGWLLIQRFGYRQVMYWVMVKSVYTAIYGAVVGWGKLERKATVTAQA